MWFSFFITGENWIFLVVKPSGGAVITFRGFFIFMPKQIRSIIEAPTKYPELNKTCIRCGKEFCTRSARRFLCRTGCNPSLDRGKNITSGIASGTVGAIAELMVGADLMLKGYEVFRALSPASHADIIAVKNNAIFRIEVRTGQYYKGRMSYPKHGMGEKVAAVVTHEDKKIHYMWDV